VRVAASAVDAGARAALSDVAGAMLDVADDVNVDVLTDGNTGADTDVGSATSVGALVAMLTLSCLGTGGGAARVLAPIAGDVRGDDAVAAAVAAAVTGASADVTAAGNRRGETVNGGLLDVVVVLAAAVVPSSDASRLLGVVPARLVNGGNARIGGVDAPPALGA
jgi:hypothetical protein